MPDLWLYTVLTTLAYCLISVLLYLAIRNLNQKADVIVTDFDTAVQAWVDYAETLKTERDAAETALKAALATNAQLVATDAAEDAAQAQALQAQLTGELEAALATVQTTAAQPPKDKPVKDGPGKQTDKPDLATAYDGPKDDKPAFDQSKGDPDKDNKPVTLDQSKGDPDKGDKDPTYRQSK